MRYRDQKQDLPVVALKQMEKKLEWELQRVKLALRALGENGVRGRDKAQRASPPLKYSCKCYYPGCGKLFKARRPDAMYCHNPHTSLLLSDKERKGNKKQWLADQKSADQKTKKVKKEKERPLRDQIAKNVEVIVKGDPLTAGH